MPEPKVRYALRYQRMKADKSGPQIARKIGITPSHYAKIERGELNLTIERAAKIAEFLGVPIEALL